MRYNLSGASFSNGVIGRRLIAVDGDTVVSVHTGEPKSNSDYTIEIPPEWTIYPGLIDIQINGAFGFEFKTAPLGIEHISRKLPEYGVTSFLPTITTTTLGRYPELLQTLESGWENARLLARPLGVHLEGPIINPAKRGAHPIEHIIERVDNNTDLSFLFHPLVALVTIAPEVPGALTLISKLSEKAKRVALGHSLATLEQVEEAIARGATFVVHIFNAMGPISARNVSMPTVALTNRSLYFGIIPDGLHVSPDVVRLCFLAAGNRMVATSDASALLGCEDGQYQVGERLITKSRGVASLQDGTLAGSVLALNDGVRNLCNFAKVPVEQIISSFTTAPAKVAGAERRGVIKRGFLADLVIMDSAMRVMGTICEGRLVYATEEFVSVLPSNLLNAIDFVPAEQ